MHATMRGTAAMTSVRSNSTTNVALVAGAIFASVAAVVSAAVIVVRALDPPAESHHHDRDDQVNGIGASRHSSHVPSAYDTLISSRTGFDKNHRHGHSYWTPLVKLERLSRLIRRNIYVKMESLNPGGTGKDRAALAMITDAEARGELPPPITDIVDINRFESSWSRPPDNPTGNDKATKDCLYDESILQAMRQSRTGGLVVEGTSGSTGISLAMIALAHGHACLVVLPDDQAVEKRQLLQALHAVVHVVPTASISNPMHYVNVARQIALRAVQHFQIRATFSNQFENMANCRIHYETTGPEIFRQLELLQNRRGLQHKDVISAFCMSSGTGGTIAGVGKYLKEQTNNKVKIVLADPPGSVLYNAVAFGVAYTTQQQERTVKRHRYDTIAEGIGLDRLTANFESGKRYIDHAVQVSDQEAVDMAHFLLVTEGLFVGSSSAANLVGLVRSILQLNLPINSNLVTVICDSGSRHVTRFWNPQFICSRGLQWPNRDEIIPKDDLDEAGRDGAGIGHRSRLPACLVELQNAEAEIPSHHGTKCA
jgi:cysteine synthase